MSRVGDKVWHIAIPGVYGWLLSDPDANGNMAAMIHDSSNPLSGVEGDTAFVGIFHIDEISFIETVPVPDGVPEDVYVVLHGADPSLWKGHVVASLREAAQFVADRDDCFGYVPAKIQRGAMVPNTQANDEHVVEAAETVDS